MNIELTEEGYTLDGKCKLVPVELTIEMRNAAHEAMLFGEKYKLALSASPKPELPQQEWELIHDKEKRSIKIKRNFISDKKIVHYYVPKTNLLRRSGDIKLDDEMLPEFEQSKYLNTKHWCNGCGVDINHLHLPSCPTLKSNL